VKRIVPLCYVGFFAILLIWLLPARCKPYRIRHDFEDYKILLVEKDAQWGFDSNGLVKIDTMLAFGIPPHGNRELLDPIRREYIQHIERSKLRWPLNSWKLHYDEWGPSRTTQDDGVERTLQGNVYCLPYSMILILLGITIILDQTLRLRRRASLAN
jgi:hypothetical protein